MPIFEHPSFVQLRQPSVQARQLASGATKIDFSAGLIDFVSGLDRSAAITKSIIAAQPSSVRSARRLILSVWLFRSRIDHLADLGDLRCRKATDLRVLPNDVLVFGEINAERLVVGDVGLNPLDVRTKLA